MHCINIKVYNIIYNNVCEMCLVELNDLSLRDYTNFDGCRSATV